MTAIPRLLLLLAVASAVPSRAGRTFWGGDKQVAELFDAQWARTAKTDRLYSGAITPVFPATWPPNGDGRVAYIAYSSGLRPGVADGEDVGSPWGRIVKDLRSSRVSFERLSAKPKDLGTQGVQPLSNHERDIAGLARDAEDEVRALSKKKGIPALGAPLVRTYYCQWRRFDGVIAKTLPKPQSDFLRWLDCDAHEPPSNLRI